MKLRLLFFVSMIINFYSCSTVKYSVKKNLPVFETQRIFEHEIIKTWTATYNTVASVADIEIAEQSDGIIKTNWNYTTSDINIAEYNVNDQKRYKNLKLRFRYTIFLEQVTGGVKVTINSEQEYEKLSGDIITPSGSWVSTVSSTAREHELLNSIKNEILKL